MIFKAKITKISQKDDINSLEFCAGELKLKMLALEIPASLQISQDVGLGFKSSDVIIALNSLENCSLSNEIKAKIIRLDTGEILSVVRLENSEGIFESIITTASAKRLNLSENLSVFCYIKATALYISEIL